MCETKSIWRSNFLKLLFFKNITSLKQQLTSCAVVPDRFRVLVAKGVNAPIAAYREVCPHHIRVNTPGSTCADLTRFDFHHRRRPMFPFERDTSWSPGEDSSAPHPGHS